MSRDCFRQCYGKNNNTMRDSERRKKKVEGRKTKEDNERMRDKEIEERGGIGWLVGFYGISTFVGYLTPNISLYK